MTTQGREQLTTKYQGIFDRAMEGHSPKSGIHANCLICLGCDTKAIKTCDNSDCPLWPYRPYQDKPPDRRKKRTQNTDEKGKFLKIKGGPVSKDIIIPNAPEGELHVQIVVKPKSQK